MMRKLISGLVLLALVIVPMVTYWMGTLTVKSPIIVEETTINNIDNRTIIYESENETIKEKHENRGKHKGWNK